MATIATSTVTIYIGTEITRDKNRLIEALESYLNTKTKFTFENCQYFKHSLHAKLKLSLDQGYATDLASSKNIDYVKIKNSTDSQSVYYFVDDKKWLSQNTVELTLTMDTIHTYQGKFVTSPKSRILRCHKDRFQTATVNNESVIIRKIDKTPEGLVSTLFRDKDSDADIYCNELSSGRRLDPVSDYYLVFQTDSGDSNHPINMFLIGKESKTWLMGNEAYSISLTYSQLKNIMLNGYGGAGQGYEAVAYYSNSTNGPVTLSFYNSNNVVIGEVTIHRSNGTNNGRLLRIYSPDLYGDTMRITSHIFDAQGNIDQTNRMWNPTSLSDVGYIESFSYCKITSGSTSKSLPFYKLQSRLSDYNTVGQFSIVRTIQTATTTYHTDNEFTTGGIRRVNRTMSNLNKIVMIPYKAFENDWSQVADLPVVDTTKWVADEIDCGDSINVNALRYIKDDFYDNPGCTFRGIKKTALGDVDPLAPIDYRPSNIVNTASRTKLNESKLFNSEFYQPKVVYDSYGQTFLLEYADPFAYMNNKPFTYTFIPSVEMISAFLIKFPDYAFDISTSDYSGVMQVQRNNEITLYQSAYLDYMRVGYNWDQKAAKRQKEGLIRSAVTGGLGTASSMFSSGVAENYLGMATAGLSFLVQGQGLIAQANQIDENMARKLEELEAQTASATGVSDCLLAESFNNNKLRYVLYKPSEVLENMVYDFFYYFGYASNAMGNPQNTTYTSSRYWFNFIQAEIVFDDTTNVTAEIGEDIKRRYADGLTIMHSHIINNTITWDMAQEKENWEITLLHD